MSHETNRECLQNLKRVKQELYVDFPNCYHVIKTIFQEDEIPLLSRFIITGWDLCDGNSALNSGKIGELSERKFGFIHRVLYLTWVGIL